MRWKRPAFWLMVVAVGGAALSIAACLFFVSGSKVAPRVRPGMTRAEARAAVGRPPDHSWAQPADDGIHRMRVEYWRHGDGTIFVTVDESGVVVRSQFIPDGLSLLDRLKKMLGL